jgi:hypothetical protein
MKDGGRSSENHPKMPSGTGLMISMKRSAWPTAWLGRILEPADCACLNSETRFQWPPSRGSPSSPIPPKRWLKGPSANNAAEAGLKALCACAASQTANLCHCSEGRPGRLRVFSSPLLGQPDALGVRKLKKSGPRRGGEGGTPGPINDGPTRHRRRQHNTRRAVEAA